MFIDDVSYELDFDELYLDEYQYDQPEASSRFDALSLVSIFLILFMVSKVLIDRTRTIPSTLKVEENIVQALDHQLIELPYNSYVLTQGPHGASYGHMAIDLAAGKNTTIKSPINGEVSALFVDEYKNPTLIIENDTYIVTMLHGKYNVKAGDKLQIGQPVGRESNLGYTTDMQGRSCKNRNCGYHTHLNIFDKTLNTNVNPLEVLELR